MSAGRVTIHVVPRARTTELAGVHGDAIRIRIAAPPANGAANKELLRYVAETLGVPQRSVRLVSGALARRKVIEVDGVSAEGLRRTLTADG